MRSLAKGNSTSCTKSIGVVVPSMSSSIAFIEECKKDQSTDKHGCTQMKNRSDLSVFICVHLWTLSFHRLNLLPGYNSPQSTAADSPRRRPNRCSAEPTPTCPGTAVSPAQSCPRKD